MKIAGVILAGGASARMGEHKPFMPFRSATLIEAVIARVKPQVNALAIDVAPSMTEIYRARLRETVLPDVFAETLGPLCGVVTGLMWSDSDWLATFPSDTPFLPSDTVEQLTRHAGKSPVVAKGAQVCGLWPKTCLARLKEGVESGELRSVLGAVEFFGGAVCEVRAPEHAFFNVNTRDDLKEAEALSPP
jgi:molybdopterin-guanine dinucleotide biosynthesis protein A